MRRHPGRHLLAMAVIGVLAAALAWPLAEGPPPGTFLAQKGRDALFFLRYVLGRNPPLSDRIVLVAVDEVTVAAPELQKPMAHWSGEHARVLEALARGGAAVVALDLVQPYPGQVEEDDQALARTLRESPVTLGVDLDDASGALAPPNPMLFYAAASAVGDPAEIAGLVRLSRDPDSTLRRASFAHRYYLADREEKTVLTLWFQGARRLLGLSLEEIEEAWASRTGDRMTLAGREVPLVSGAPGEDREYMLINYAGPDRTVPRISYAEVLRRHEDEDWLREQFQGRLVFLGVTVADMQDHHLSPMGWVQRLTPGEPLAPSQPRAGSLVGRREREADDEMAGTEIQAQAANTLVTGAFLALPSAWLAWAWTLAWCFLAAATGAAPRLRLALFPLLLVATAAAALAAFVARGLVLPLAWPLSGSLLAFAGGIGWRHNTTDAERRRIRGLLGRYVSDRVATLVVDHPEEASLGGRSAEVTLLFSDLNHFTTWSEKTDPEAVIATMNEYFTAMEDVIFRYGGTLKQFVGDEIMVIFGAPFPQADAEERAVRTALAMEEGLDRLGALWAPRGIPRLQAKIGVHRGRVVVGNVGSPRRTEYAAVGDAVNLASRVMGLTKVLGHQVLITEAVYERVKDLVEVQEFPPQSVKGREEQVRVYGLEAVKPPTGPAAGPPAG